MCAIAPRESISASTLMPGSCATTMTDVASDSAATCMSTDAPAP
jgi:hypothetical protein